MKTVTVHRAQPTVHSKDPGPVTIVAERVREFDSSRTLADLVADFDRDGKALSDAIFDHLPGGTIDALLRHMLERRASLFIVKF